MMAGLKLGVISVNKKEFKELIESLDISVNFQDFEENTIGIKWITGGMRGGSCWDEGNSQRYASEGDPKPEFEDLDLILEKVMSNITFLQYKKLCKFLIKEKSWSEDEYYGNSTNYIINYIFIDELYDYLMENLICE